MDEILIEEKKYVSSKRAAQITGYAKDYIGQLCREGRVPARLVGRSWYVLESAIQDHRFGNQETSNPPAEEKKIPRHAVGTWESPRYETQEALHTNIPPVNRLEEGKGQEQEDAEASKDLHDSWKSWFAHFESSVPTTVLAPEVTTDLIVDSGETIDEKSELAGEIARKEESVDIPIHIMGQTYPPKELLPRKIDDESSQDAVFAKEETLPTKELGTSLKTRILSSLQVLGVLIAVSLVALSIIASGYLDKLLVSLNQAGYVTGISVYNK